MIAALIALGVFCASAALDFALARHVQALRDGDGHRAGLWSAGACLLSAAMLWAFVDVSRGMVLVECLGFYVGTRIATRRATLST